MHRITSRLTLFCLAVLLLITGNAYAWGSKPLVTINDQEYNSEDFLQWWKYWNNNKPAPLPEKPDEFVDFHLLAQEGYAMEYYLDPSYKHKLRVFLKVRTMMLLKNDEIDSKIKISEKDVDQYYKKTYTPIWAIQILTYPDIQTAGNAYEKVFPFNGQPTGRLIFADLQGVSKEDGGPLGYEEAKVTPEMLTSRKLENWLQVLQQSDAQNIVAPFQDENDPGKVILLRIDSIDMPPEDDLEKRRDKIRHEIGKAERGRLTNELIKRLIKKYEVKVDEELLKELDPAREYSAEYLEQDLVTMRDFNVSVGVFLQNYRTQAGRRSGLTPREMKRALVNSILSQVLIDKEALSRGYEKEPPLKWGYEFYKQNRLKGLVEKDLRDKVTASDEEIAEYYKSNMAEYSMPEMVAYAVINGEESLIKKMWTGILTGADFFEIAEKYSKIVENKNTALDALPVALRRVIDKLAINEVGDPMQTGDGYALVKLLNRVPSQSRSLGQVRAEVVERVKKAKYAAAKAAYLQQLRSLSTIKINADVWEQIVRESKNEKE